jgi:hypothetical protein
MKTPAKSPRKFRRVSVFGALGWLDGAMPLANGIDTAKTPNA